MDNEEFFYGITLTGAGATKKWEFPKVDEEGLQLRHQRLVIKNLLLGHEAKADEYNVVEAAAPSAKGDVVKIPIAVLKVGEARSMNPHLEFPDGPVTFTLISGSGPVHIHGLLGVGGLEEEDMEELEVEEVNDESEDDECEHPEDAEEEDEENGAPKKKIKLAANNGKAANNLKKK